MTYLRYIGRLARARHRFRPRPRQVFSCSIYEAVINRPQHAGESTLLAQTLGHNFLSNYLHILLFYYLFFTLDLDLEY